MAIVLIDSYSEVNTDDFDWQDTSDNTGDGVTFGTTSSLPLYSVKFYLLKVGSPTGNMVAKVYNLTGTVGTNATPTGSALATSDVISIATLTGSYQLVEFKFTGANAIILGSSTHYGVSVEYSGGNSSNKLQVGLDSSSPVWSNNIFIRLNNGTSWIGFASNSDAFPFYLYGGSPTQTRLHTTSSFLRKRIIKVHSTSSNLKGKKLRAHTTSSSLSIHNARLHTTSSFLRKRIIKVHSTSSYIRKVYYRMHTLDSLLRKRNILAQPIFADARQITPIGFK